MPFPFSSVCCAGTSDYTNPNKEGKIRTWAWGEHFTHSCGVRNGRDLEDCERRWERTDEPATQRRQRPGKQGVGMQYGEWKLEGEGVEEVRKTELWGGIEVGTESWSHSVFMYIPLSCAMGTHTLLVTAGLTTHAEGRAPLSCCLPYKAIHQNTDCHSNSTQEHQCSHSACNKGSRRGHRSWILSLEWKSSSLYIFVSRFEKMTHFPQFIDFELVTLC